jgi:uncharacterized membrane protein YkoI
MKHLTRWILALVALAAVADLSGAFSAPQDPAKPERKLDKAPQKKVANPNRAERQAALKRTIPTLKTSLSEAIALAEKETTGKAWAAELSITETKVSIQVQLLASDKFTVVTVDPETKKVTPKKAMESEGEHDEHGHEGKDEDGG